MSVSVVMPFQAVCCCPWHDDWKHGKVTSQQLRICTREETNFFSLNAEDTKSKGRKRKVCISCRSRLEVEAKCQKLEVRCYMLSILKYSMKACSYCCLSLADEVYSKSGCVHTVVASEILNQRMLYLYYLLLLSFLSLQDVLQIWRCLFMQCLCGNS